MHATLDKPMTDAELEQFYGLDKPNTTHKLIIDTMTKTVRRVSHKALSLPYVKPNRDGSCAVAAYSLLDVVKDYGTEPGPLQALMRVLEGSDCPLVAEWRAAIALRFAEANADEVEEILQ